MHLDCWIFPCSWVWRTFAELFEPLSSTFNRFETFYKYFEPFLTFIKYFGPFKTFMKYFEPLSITCHLYQVSWTPYRNQNVFFHHLKSIEFFNTFLPISYDSWMKSFPPFLTPLNLHRILNFVNPFVMKNASCIQLPYPCPSGNGSWKRHQEGRRNLFGNRCIGPRNVPFGSYQGENLFLLLRFFPEARLNPGRFVEVFFPHMFWTLWKDRKTGMKPTAWSPRR